MEKAKLVKVFIVALIALAIAALAYQLFARSESSVMEQLRGFLLFSLEGRGYYQRILIASLFVGLANGLLIPINIPLLLVALFIPGWPAFFAGLLGSVLAALIGYLYGHQLVSRHYLEKKLGKKRYEIITSEIGNNAFKAVVLLCLAPIAPNIATNILAGLCKIPVWKLVLGTLVGFLPGVTILTLLGREIRAMVEEPGYQAAVWLIAIAGLVALSYKLGKRIQARLEKEVAS